MLITTPVIIVDRYVSHILEDTNYPSGGAAVQLLSWIDGLLKNDIPVFIICDEEPLHIEARFNKVHFIPLNRRKKRLKKELKPFRYFIGLFRVLNREEAVVYQTGAGILTFIVALLSRYYKHLFVHRVANDADVDKRIYKKLPYYKAYLYNRGKSWSDLVVCQNRYQYNHVLKNRSASDVAILPNPYVDFYQPNKNHSLDNRSYFAWAGIFQHQKNLPMLLDIARELEEEKIHIAGVAAGSMDTQTSDAVRQLKSLHNVTFRGFIKREEMPAFYANAIALINTSYYEGFPNTFLEAWSAGTPVITSEKVNPNHVVSDHQTGIVTKSFQDYIGAVKSMKERSYFTFLSNNCRQYVETYHDAGKLTRELMQLIHGKAKE